MHAIFSGSHPSIHFFETKLPFLTFYVKMAQFYITTKMNASQSTINRERERDPARATDFL